MAEHIAPFQTVDDEYAFDENLLMEEEPDGMIAIGSPTNPQPTNEPILREHDANLADGLDEDELNAIGQKMIQDYDADKMSRDDWLKVYKDGLKSLAPTQSHTTDPKMVVKQGKNLATVVHPLIAEAATQFQARAINELFPPQGPVGSKIIGDATAETQDQSRRVSTFMNYQLTEEMEEYFPDQDQMLFHLPLVGQTYKKPYFDVNLGRITSRFIKAENFVMDANATNIMSAKRYHHEMTISSQEFAQYVDNEFYLEVPTGNDFQLGQTTEQEIDGVDPTPSINSDESDVELIETHGYLDIESKEGELDKPFVITTHKVSQKVVAIRRNWDPSDSKHRMQRWFVEYKFLPGLGAYGFGLYHIIGGLGEAATGALRSLLDAAAFANMQGGFKLRGRVKGGSIEIAPGQFVDIEAAVDDVKKAIMPLPFKEPSQTMMLLLQFIVATGQKFANTVETNLSDANQNTPVGTTMALLEENSRVFSAVHKRLHNSQKQEFKLIAKLNGIYLPERYPYRADSNPNEVILRKDFDARIDVVPVSDPATFSSTQRISQAQAALQMADSHPQYHNRFKALKRMYEALRIPNYDEILIDPDNAFRQDAVAENMALMNQKPVRVFEDQDHMAHMTVLDDWFSRIPPDMQPLYLQSYTAHRSEHMSLYYRAQVQAQLTAPLPPIPQTEEEKKDIDPRLDAMISQAAAQITMEQAEKNPIGPKPPSPQAQDAAQDPMKAAQMLAEAEAMSIQVKSQANAQATMAKAQIDMQIKQANAQLDMQLESIKAKYQNEERLMRKEAENRQDDRKLEAELERMHIKAQAEIQIAREKAELQIQAKQIEGDQKQMSFALDQHNKQRDNDNAEE